MKHHYQDTAKNYGFTSTIWDKILDTEIEVMDKAKKRVSTNS